MATSDAMRARIEAFARELCEEFGEVDDSNALSWLDAIEERAIQVGDAVTTALVEKNASGRAEQQEAACPECGQVGQRQGDRERSLLTRRGKATISEPEYYCPCCRKAFFPDDGRDRR